MCRRGPVFLDCSAPSRFESRRNRSARIAAARCRPRTACRRNPNTAFPEASRGNCPRFEKAQHDVRVRQSGSRLRGAATIYAFIAAQTRDLTVWIFWASEARAREPRGNASSGPRGPRNDAVQSAKTALATFERPVSSRGRRGSAADNGVDGRGSAGTAPLSPCEPSVRAVMNPRPQRCNPSICSRPRRAAEHRRLEPRRLMRKLAIEFLHEADDQSQRTRRIAICDEIFVGTFQPRSPQMGGSHAPEEMPTGQAISATR